MPEIKQTERVTNLLNCTVNCCKNYRHEFVMPEHLLLSLTDDNDFQDAMDLFTDPYELAEEVANYLEEVEVVPTDVDYEPVLSEQMSKVLETAVQTAHSSQVAYCL